MKKKEISDTEFKAKQDLTILEIGRFVITFEHIASFLKDSMISILKNEGLSDILYSHIILKEIPAETLRNVFEKIAPVYFKKRSEQLFIKKILNQFNKLNQIRNKIIHCFWVPATLAEEPFEPIAIGLKRRITDKGLSRYNLDLEYKDLLVLNSDSKKFKKIMTQFSKNIDNKELVMKNISNEQIQDLKFKEVIEQMNLII